MANEAAGHTLQPTGLVHQAWLRLGGSDAPTFQSRTHFFGAAAEAMRRILIESARRRIAAKRGAGIERVDLDEIEIPAPLAEGDQLLAVNQALEKFAALDPRKAELVKLRYFVGMNFDEAATALGIALPTAKQWWAYARAWLTVELRDGATALRSDALPRNRSTTNGHEPTRIKTDVTSPRCGWGLIRVHWCSAKPLMTAAAGRGRHSRVQDFRTDSRHKAQGKHQ